VYIIQNEWSCNNENFFFFCFLHLLMFVFNCDQFFFFVVHFANFIFPFSQTKQINENEKRQPIFVYLDQLFLDMNKCEQTGAEELLSMLSDEELMSVKDTVTKSMISTDSVRIFFKKNFLFILFI